MTSPAESECLNDLRVAATGRFGAERTRTIEPYLEGIAQALAVLWRAELPWQASAPDFLTGLEAQR